MLCKQDWLQVFSLMCEYEKNETFFFFLENDMIHRVPRCFFSFVDHLGVWLAWWQADE